MTKATVAVVTIVACLALSIQSSRADCRELAAVPFGVDSLKDGMGKACGYTGRSVSPDVSPNNGDEWSAINYTDPLFKPVALPMGSRGFCSQMAPSKYVSGWSGISDLLIRRTFSIDQNALASIKNMVVTYMVDDMVSEIFLNGEPVEFNVRPFVRGCQALTARVPVIVPLSALTAGQNVLALRAKNVRGDAYLDLALSFTMCSEAGSDETDLHACSAVDSASAGTGCRARCETEGYCRNKAPEECGTSYHADVMGSCLCEAVDTLSCSGAPADEAPGVCYASTWMPSKVARLSVCVPDIALACDTSAPVAIA